MSTQTTPSKLLAAKAPAPADEDDDSASQYTWTTDNESTVTGYTTVRSSRRLVWGDGSIFEGPVNSASRPEGEGELRASNGDEYRGGWVDGAMHGWGTYVMKQKGLYEGGVANNRRNGSGHFKCVRGVEYEGEWKDDKPHGMGKFSQASSGVWYEGEWRNGRAHGVGVFSASRWGTYTGEWRHDKKHGEGRAVYVDGASYEGDWKEDVAHGSGKYTWPNGDTYEGQFHQGTMTGQGTVTTAKEGTTYKGMWQNNSREGYGQLVFVDGAVYEGEWTGDRPHGRGVFINPRGVMFRGYWTDGVFDAVQSECDPRGVCTCVVEGNDYAEIDDMGRILPKTVHPAPVPGSSEAPVAMPRHRYCELAAGANQTTSETLDSVAYPQVDGHPVNPLECGYMYHTTFGKEQLPSRRTIHETAVTCQETVYEEAAANAPPHLAAATGYTTQLPGATYNTTTAYNTQMPDSGETTRVHHSTGCLCGGHYPPITNIINTHHHYDTTQQPPAQHCHVCTHHHVYGEPPCHNIITTGAGAAEPNFPGVVIPPTRVHTGRIPGSTRYPAPEPVPLEVPGGGPRWAEKVEAAKKRMPLITPHLNREHTPVVEGPQMTTVTYTREVPCKPSTPKMSSTEIYDTVEEVTAFNPRPPPVQYFVAPHRRPPPPMHYYAEPPRQQQQTAHQPCRQHSPQIFDRQLQQQEEAAGQEEEQQRWQEEEEEEQRWQTVINEEQSTAHHQMINHNNHNHTRDILRNIPIPVEAEINTHFTLPQIRTTRRTVPFPVYAPRIIEVPVPIETLSDQGLALCDNIAMQVEDLRRQGTGCGVEAAADNILNLLAAAETIPGSHARPLSPSSLERFLPADFSNLNRPEPSSTK